MSCPASACILYMKRRWCRFFLVLKRVDVRVLMCRLSYDLMMEGFLLTFLISVPMSRNLSLKCVFLLIFDFVAVQQVRAPGCVPSFHAPMSEAS